MISPPSVFSFTWKQYNRKSVVFDITFSLLSAPIINQGWASHTENGLVQLLKRELSFMIVHHNTNVLPLGHGGRPVPRRSALATSVRLCHGGRPVPRRSACATAVGLCHGGRPVPRRSTFAMAVGLCQGSLHSRPGCLQTGVRLIRFLLQ